MKKILLGVAVAVAVLAGCNLGLDNGGRLEGNKWDATFPVDGTGLTSGYMRLWSQFGSANANKEQVQAITSRITVNKDGSILSNASDGKAVFGYIFDLDKNGGKSGTDDLLDFCSIGIRQKSNNAFEYYMERYIDVNPKELKGGTMERNALGAYFSMTASEKNKLFEADMLPGGTLSTNVEDDNGKKGSATNFTCNDSNSTVSGVMDWGDIGDFYNTSNVAYFDAYLHITQDTPGMYKVYLSKSETLNTSQAKELGTFGKADSVTLDKNSNNSAIDTSITGYKRKGPVLLGNKGAKSTEDTKSKYYLAGGVAAYASCPNGTKLSIHYNNLKESLRGDLFAQPVE